MAVVEKSTEMDLIIKVKTGMNASGDPTTSSRTIGNINPAIAAEDAYTLASGMASLQTYPLMQVVKRADTVLAEQA